MKLLSCLSFALLYNLMGLIFYAAALFFAKKGKASWQWYIIGTALQGYSTFGTILGFIKDPENWYTPEKILAVVVFFAAALLFFLLLKREQKKHA